MKIVIFDFETGGVRPSHPSDVAEHLGILTEGIHDALADVRIAASVARSLQKLGAAC